MSGARRFPDYRRVDAATVSEVPSHWDLVRGRHLARIRTGSGDTADAEPDGEYPFYVRSDQPQRSHRWEFDTTAVLTAGDGAGVAKVFHIVSGRFMAHQRVYVLDDFKRVDARFFYYQFSALFHLLALDGSAKSTVDSVRRHMIADMPFAVPPLTEQQAIVDYLDREITQIDTLIAKQELFVATLRERRSVAAAQELGDVVGAGRRLKWSVVERDERSGESLRHLPLLSVSISWGVRRRDELSDDAPRAEDLSAYKIAEAGDIVVNRMRAFQGALGVAPERGLVSPDYAVLMTSEFVDASWIATVMTTPRFVSEMTSRLKGIGGINSGTVRTPRINVADLLDISIRIPGLAQQRAQLATIAAVRARIDAVAAEAERFIELSNERRSALITAAVTGQIDVATEAA